MSKTSIAADESLPAHTKEKLAYFTPVIEKHLPMPAAPTKRERTKVARIKWPFAEMEIGDSILLPDWAEPSRASAAVEKWKRDNLLYKTYTIAIRHTPAGYRVWRTA